MPRLHGRREGQHPWREAIAGVEPYVTYMSRQVEASLPPRGRACRLCGNPQSRYSDPFCHICNEETTMVQYTKLTRRDLAGFAEEPTMLILETQALEWVGRISAKGHAILRSPEGAVTMSIPKAFTPSRGGQNARADLERWRREHGMPAIPWVPEVEPEPEMEIFTCATCHATFGREQARDEHEARHSALAPEVAQFLADAQMLATQRVTRARRLLAARHHLSESEVDQRLALLRATYDVPAFSRGHGGPVPSGWEVDAEIADGKREPGTVPGSEPESTPVQEPVQEQPDEEPVDLADFERRARVLAMIEEIVSHETETLREQVIRLTTERDEARAEAEKYKNRWEALTSLVQEED